MPKRALPLATNIFEGFQTFVNAFNTHTRLAPLYFSQRDWHASQQNHRNRLQLYKDLLIQLSGMFKEILGKDNTNREIWKLIRSEYQKMICKRNDVELAKTFFNSVFRKTFPDNPLDEELMYVREGFNSRKISKNSKLLLTYHRSMGLEKIIRKILEDFDFGIPFMDKEQDVKFLVDGVNRVIQSRYKVEIGTTTQLLKSVFYRNKSAYLIGRTFVGKKWMPFIIPILNGPKGIYVDTLIFDPNLMSHLFSFTRSYFMVDAEIPSQIIGFLSSIIPQKKIHELYNAIGFNKHGKTLFYEDYLNHLEKTNDLFVLAPGIKGMVMTVFTLPSLNIVFKVIKDDFEPPKTLTRKEVKEKYKIVSLHDRVGRMADTHEFEQFRIPVTRISGELMQELRNTVNSLIRIEGDVLVFQHLYTERRMIPLNIFLETCSTEEGRKVVEDYGRAILNLAQANIFPGDMMTKNFGLTRQTRVIFYDYDEIEFLEDLNFRVKPKPVTYEQIYSAEPWYEIKKNDVFPEDFKRWMIGRTDLKPHFLSYHKDLFDPAFWKALQDRIRKGELIHAFPYPDEIRFRPDESD